MNPVQLLKVLSSFGIFKYFSNRKNLETIRLRAFCPDQRKVYQLRYGWLRKSGRPSAGHSIPCVVSYENSKTSPRNNFAPRTASQLAGIPGLLNFSEV